MELARVSRVTAIAGVVYTLKGIPEIHEKRMLQLPQYGHFSNHVFDGFLFQALSLVHVLHGVHRACVTFLDDADLSENE